jgi:hypothetical protein
MKPMTMRERAATALVLADIDKRKAIFATVKPGPDGFTHHPAMHGRYPRACRAAAHPQTTHHKGRCGVALAADGEPTLIGTT